MVKVVSAVEVELSFKISIFVAGNGAVVVAEVDGVTGSC